MNKVILIGRLTKDPEIRKTSTDISNCRFTIAVNRDYTSQGQEQKADFISCVAWRNQAENLCKYQRKGNQIAVEGNIQVESYDDASGVRKYITEVVVNRIDFLDSAAKKTENQYAESQHTTKEQQYRQANKQWQQQAFQNTNADISSDDLPF